MESDGYGYDHENRLTHAEGTRVGLSTYQYDGDGLRAGALHGETDELRHTWDVAAGLPVVLQDTETTLGTTQPPKTTSYVWGLGLIAEVGDDGAREYHHRDATGSTRVLTDAAGAKVGVYDYDVWGGVRAKSGVATAKHTYTGERQDRGTGLYYLRARHYDPRTGRFMSRDPIGFAGGDLNLYAYAGNNPVNYSDPSGLCQDPGGTGIRYCIEAYISKPTAWGFTGDNRGPQHSGGPYRFHQQIWQPAGGGTQESHSPGTSRRGRFSETAAMGACGASSQARPGGGRTITARCGASDGLLYGLAPQASYDITITESKEGLAQVNVNGRSDFPSIEVWRYGGGGGTEPPRLVYHYDEGGHGPEALFVEQLSKMPVTLPPGYPWLRP